jgi:hypothetical protein
MGNGKGPKTPFFDFSELAQGNQKLESGIFLHSNDLLNENSCSPYWFYQQSFIRSYKKKKSPPPLYPPQAVS